METPIPIINNTHIELRKVKKFKGEYGHVKVLMYLADIIRIEVTSHYETGAGITKIVLKDEYSFNVLDKLSNEDNALF